MRATLKKQLSFVLIAALIVALAAGLGYSLVSGVAYAVDTPDSSLGIVQMSDIHYFPLDSCYQAVNDPNYEQSEFYHSTTGDTKLVLESGVILNNAVHKVIEKVQYAKDNNEVGPMYFIATGDLCKNGERAALIDVANALRFMQNEIRKIQGYENFQVLAQVGNHDLYNTDAALYSQKDGKTLIADAVTSEQFALIFAGLGFPDASLDGKEGTVNLTEYLPAEYWYSPYTGTYQESKNASNLTINYFSPALNAVKSAQGNEKLEKYFEIGDGLNQLTYSVEIADSDYGFIIFDSTDREVTDEGKPVRLSQEEYNYFKNNGVSNKYYLGTDEGSIDMSKTMSADNEITGAFESGKAVYRAAPRAHITGGRLTEDVINWAEEFANSMHEGPTNDGEKTLIAGFHHNLLPHFEQEDDILKDFTLYNWEYTAKRLLGMGIRYVFTGHQHSSDIASYTDVEGRTIYDSETGSMVSYESPRRYVTISRYISGDDLSESMVSSIEATADMKEIASSNITAAAAWDEVAYQTALTNWKNASAAEKDAKWEEVLASNPDYVAYIVAHDRLFTRNYNQYIGEEIYTRLVDRILAHFLTGDTVDSLLQTVHNMVGGLSLGGVLDAAIPNLTGFQLGEGGSLQGFVDYLLDILVNNLYPDTDSDDIGNYPYKNNTYNGLLEYLRAIINDLVDMEFGDSTLAPANGKNPTNAGKMTLKEMAGFIMMAHATGTEVKLVESDEALQAEYKAIDDAGFEDLDASVGEFAYKNPIDRTYRKRMTAALKDAHEQLVSGKFAGDLVNALLDPLFNEDNSLLKRILTIEIDLEDGVDAGYYKQSQFNTMKTGLKEKLPKLLQQKVIQNALKSMLGVELGADYELPSIDANHFVIGTFLNALLPIAKPVVANLIGFNLDGPDIVTILQNAIDGYITDSFLVGLGGIADKIVVSYATDDFPDIADMTNAALPFLVQPYAGYTADRTYDSTKVTPSTVGATFNAATQDNGRVPSRVTANFDTVDSTDTYTFKFYTAEEIYGRFEFRTDKNATPIVISTSKDNAHEEKPYFDSTATYNQNGIKIEMLTQTRPAYVPLIDLGLACITHGEIVNEIENDDETIEIPIKYGQRDSAPSASVIYWNVHTVTVSGLKPDTTYLYDLKGVYETEDDTTLTFSLVENAGKEYYQFTTGADETKTDFEFLTIADIQGMIQGMYSNSHKAVEALLADERTKDFNFLLNAGDMVDNGKNFAQWGMALNTYEDLFANTSQFFTAGNHEDGKNAFATYFNYTLPTNSEGAQLQEDITDGAFYSFDYGNSHFTVLNTNDATTAGLGEIQLNWLKDDLNKAQDKTWRFVLMHKSLFSGGSHSYDGEVVAMRAQLVPIFNQYHVNIVFAGHDHTYTTTKLLDKNGKIVDKPDLNGVRYTGDGVMFVTLGTLGTKFYTYGENGAVTPKFDKNNSVLHTLDSQTFGKVKVSANEIVFTGYYFNPETGKLEVIGSEMTLTTKKVFPAVGVYAIIGVVVGLVVIAAVVVTIVLVKKKKKAGAPEGGDTLEDETDGDVSEPVNGEETPDDVSDEESNEIGD